MERVTRTLGLIELKAPALILADGMMLIKESATLLEKEFTKPGWGEVIRDAHDNFVAYQERENSVMVSCCCAAEILDLDICSQCREHCEPIEEGKDE